MTMLQHAFKEWAVICRALAEGRQSIILRKGGIAEDGGDFQVEHTRFWLFPTYVHQQTDGIQEDARPLLEQALAEKPPPGTLHLSHWVEVTGVYHVHDLTLALLLAHLHSWTPATVEKRFNYRSPGIYVLASRVHRAPQVHVVPDLPRYEGCRSWVELEEALPTEGSQPVLSEAAYRNVLLQLDMILRPTALA